MNNDNTPTVAAVPATWQPIETAPKYESVLILNRGRLVVEAWLCTAWDRWVRMETGGADTKLKPTHWMPLPAAPAPAPEPGFVFQVGQQYETQAGKLVTVLGRITLAGAQCLICSDEKYRYDRLGDPSDAGRVTGTPHDYSWPGNFKRNVARAAAPAPAVNQELLEKLTAWQAVCDRITDQYGGVVAGVDFGALGRATRAAITRAESGAPAPAPQPQPQPLTDERIEAIAHRKAWRYRHDGESTGSHLYTFNRHTLLDFAHALGITGGATGDKA